MIRHLDPRRLDPRRLAGTAAAALAGLAWASPALAHPGHPESGLAAGLLHPLTGADHLMAMVMIGLWAGLVAGRALWVLPASFLAAMLCGFAYGAVAGTGGHGAEDLIVASLLVLGVAVALRLRAPLVVAAGAAATFGFAHGVVHGAESPGGAAALAFAGGFLVTTAALHALGLLIARRLPSGWSRASGLVAAGLGLALAGAA